VRTSKREYQNGKGQDEASWRRCGCWTYLLWPCSRSVPRDSVSLQSCPHYDSQLSAAAIRLKCSRRHDAGDDLSSGIPYIRCHLGETAAGQRDRAWIDDRTGGSRWSTYAVRSQEVSTLTLSRTAAGPWPPIRTSKITPFVEMSRVRNPAGDGGISVASDMSILWCGSACAMAQPRRWAWPVKVSDH
jgi:hypothetical protein